MAKREPQVFHSDLHLPRWKRVLIWLLENPVGFAATNIAACVLVFSPVYFFGYWWLAVFFAALVGFMSGWNMAVSRMLRGEGVGKF